MSTPAPKYTDEETARRGDEIYERKVRPLVEPQSRGKVVAIDVDSADFAVADTAAAASDKLREKHPDAEVWLIRVGEPTLYKIGHVPQERAR